MRIETKQNRKNKSNFFTVFAIPRLNQFLESKCLQWLALVSLAVLYNVLFVVGRAIFWEMNHVTPAFWLTMDYVCDIIYLLDMIVHAHEGFFIFFFFSYELIFSNVCFLKCDRILN